MAMGLEEDVKMRNGRCVRTLALTSPRMSQRIVIVDDEPWVHDVVSAYLENEGFTVFNATNGEAGLELAMNTAPDLVVLDLMLPDLSGEEICRRLRERSDVAIVMLTAKSGEAERIAGLGSGADDYVTKPFSPGELVARIKAVLRRTSGAEMPLVEVLCFDDGNLEIDTVRQQVSAYGASVDLTPTEYKLLTALARFPGRPYSRFELVNRIQGHDFEGYERTIDVHVRNLRRKIERDPSAPRFVETVHGVGYRLGVGSG